jgi:hypothetical protein
MLRLNSNNQIVSLYFYDNKKQTTIVNSSCHFKPNVNHLHSTPTYTSYFLLLLFVTKYYKLVVYTGGDSVKSDQTFISLVPEKYSDEGLNMLHKKAIKQNIKTSVIGWYDGKNLMHNIPGNQSVHPLIGITDNVINKLMGSI